MGAFGGAAGGTMISSLSGAALTSASLAALGPAGMAGGVATITAIGGALGGRPGAVVSNAYFGDIKDFKIEKVRRGAGPALIFIDGFLTQKKQHCDDWLEGVKEVYPNNPCYYVSWESGTLLKLGLNLPKEKLVLAAGKELAKRGGKAAAKKINPLSWVTMSSNVIANPWHTSMRKAQMTGVLLADILARTNHKEGFILMGHSLGARVAYYLLEALSTKSKARVQRAYLLGGAVGKDDDDGWTKAMKAIRSTGKLYNCYTSNDMILERLYRNVTARRSYPIGLAQIPISSYKLKNIDVSPWVSGHTMHKEALSSILRRLHRV